MTQYITISKIFSIILIFSILFQIKTESYNIDFYVYCTECNLTAPNGVKTQFSNSVIQLNKLSNIGIESDSKYIISVNTHNSNTGSSSGNKWENNKITAFVNINN